MKTATEIHESFLEPGTRFTLRNKSPQQVMAERRAFMDITGMMWLCNRAMIDCTGHLDQGHTLIMIWKN